ncbi:MAG TPA: SpoIID/LytB domain-containing protein [Candidatus Woesebacteria bacterium]|nr:SpoIID/LytB domain-containing protein [Candidatus Woesebacteria bacterium]
MRHIFYMIIMVAFIFLLPFGKGYFVYADELEDINKKLDELTKALESSQKATSTNEQELANLNTQLNSLKNQVAQIEVDIEEKAADITEGDKKLTQQKELLDQRIASYYKNKGKVTDGILQLLVTDNLTLFLKQFTYQQTLLTDDRNTIVRIVTMVKDLEDRKETLENEKERLEPIKNQIAKQSEFLTGEVASAKQYQGELQGQIASLSSRQQEILNARSGSFTANIGDSELADDYNASIKGFRESAPGGYFAVFAFGAHTHRKGMSQYGARGRAQSGQDFKTILKAYYGKEPVGKDTGGSIRVAGYGEMDFETTYLYGIAEMPATWHPEALKAQAVAARTYAYRYKSQGTEICTTEACQVFRKDKSDNPPQAWKDAVDQTKGQVLEDVVTYYASTHGAYITTPNAMWDTTDGGGGGNFVDKSYEKLGGSPWVYKAWYTQGYSVSSDKCGRSNPWLSPSEMADIINAAMVMTRGGSGADTGRVTPTTTSCQPGNPYSIDELRQVSENYGGGVSSVTGVSVSLGSGTTNEVVFQTDKGEKRLSGADFKKGFNLRAPGYLAIPQYQFAFFNIEKK